MSRSLSFAFVAALTTLAAGCRADATAERTAAEEIAAVPVSAASVVEEAIARFIEVTGT